MRVLIATVGTRGDVQPYLALAIGLRAAGHEVAICTCPRFRELLTDYGIPFLHLDDGLLKLLESDLGRSAFEDLNGLFGVLRTIPKVIKQVGPIHRQMVADCWTAAESLDPDVIVYHPKMFCVPPFAARRNIPAILAMLCPFQVPTGQAPLFGPSLGRYYNRATYRMVHRATKWGTRGYLRNWRAQHDGDGRSNGSSPTRLSSDHPIPVIHGYSGSVCQRPNDWPDHAIVTGYWFLPQDSEGANAWQPSTELVEFLALGPPPVCVGFGSIAGADPTRTTRIVMSALEQAEVRAVIATGWGGVVPSRPKILHEFTYWSQRRTNGSCRKWLRLCTTEGPVQRPRGCVQDAPRSSVLMGSISHFGVGESPKLEREWRRFHRSN